MLKRIEQFDTLKGVGIILVVLGHVFPQTGFVHNLIYGFHMPLFFFCSGVFFKERPIWDSTIKDLKTLMIPWVTFSMFLMINSMILKFFSNGEGPVLKPLDENNYVLYYTIWFLPCLFLTRFFYRFIIKNNNILIVGLLCLSGYVVAYILKLHDMNLPFFLDSAISMLLLYHCGHLFNIYGLIKRKFPLSVSVLVLVFYVVLVWLIEPQVNIKDNLYPIYLFVLSLTPIYALYQICCRIKNGFLAYCGMASLAIMGLHHPICDFEFPLMNLIHLPLLVERIIMVVITLAITLAIYKFMMVYAPFLLGKSRNE